jgi:hypothetical protein
MAVAMLENEQDLKVCLDQARQPLELDFGHKFGGL